MRGSVLTDPLGLQLPAHGFEGLQVGIVVVFSVRWIAHSFDGIHHVRWPEVPDYFFHNSEASP